MTFGGEGETMELLDAATREKLCDISVDKTVMTLRKMPDGMEIPAGTYPDAKIRLSAYNGTTSESLEVPVNLVVEE